jgi:signal recognition particle subunit SEC65
MNWTSYYDDDEPNSPGANVANESPEEKELRQALEALQKEQIELNERAFNVFRKMHRPLLMTRAPVVIEFPSGKSYQVQLPRIEWLLAHDITPHILTLDAVNESSKKIKRQKKVTQAVTSVTEAEVKAALDALTLLCCPDFDSSTAPEIDQWIMTGIAKGDGEFPNSSDLRRWASQSVEQIVRAYRQPLTSLHSLSGLAGTVTGYDLDRAGAVWAWYYGERDKEDNLAVLSALSGKAMERMFS